MKRAEIYAFMKSADVTELLKSGIIEAKYTYKISIDGGKSFIKEFDEKEAAEKYAFNKNVGLLRQQDTKERLISERYNRKRRERFCKDCQNIMLRDLVTIKLRRQ